MGEDKDAQDLFDDVEDGLGDEDAPPAVDAPEENGEHEDDEEDLPDVPERTFPTLAEYKEKWARLKAQHSKPVPGEFSRDNVVPTPVPQLWQDCPYVPFDKLELRQSQARVSDR